MDISTMSKSQLYEVLFNIKRDTNQDVSSYVLQVAKSTTESDDLDHRNLTEVQEFINKYYVDNNELSDFDSSFILAVKDKCIKDLLSNELSLQLKAASSVITRYFIQRELTPDSTPSEDVCKLVKLCWGLVYTDPYIGVVEEDNNPQYYLDDISTLLNDILSKLDT